MVEILSDDQSSGNPRAASVRISAHNAKGHSGQRRHDLRIGSQPGYVDPDRTGLNRVLIEPPSPTVMRRIAEDRRSRQGAQRAMKSNAAISTAGIITFGSEAAQMFEALTPDQQDHAFRLLSRAVAIRLRTSVHGLVVHKDEATIHAHFVLCAYNRDGLPLSKSTRPAVLSELQDLTAKVMQRFCPEIERGRRYGDRLEAGAKFSEVVHKSVRQLHRELPAKIETKRAELKALDEATATAQAKVDEMRGRVEKLAQKASLSAKEASRLEIYQKRLEERLAALSEALRASQEAKDRIDALVKVAEDRNHDIETETGRQKERITAIRTAIKAVSSEVQAGTIHRAENGTIKAKDPEPMKPVMQDIAPIVGAAADLGSLMRQQKADIAADREELRKTQALASSQQKAVQDEWAVVRNLRAKLETALKAVTGWLKNPELSLFTRALGQKVKDDAEKILETSKKLDDGLPEP